MRTLLIVALASLPSMVLFGDRAVAEDDDGTWQFLLRNHSSHSAIYDPVRNRMLVFGGYYRSTGAPMEGVWELSLSNPVGWSRLTTFGTPPPAPRWGSAAIYDPVRDRMVIFGGSTPSSLLNDVWCLSLTGLPTWTELHPASTPPDARLGASAIYDAAHDRMVIFGGNGLSGVHSNVYGLSLAGTPQWNRFPIAGVPAAIARWLHVAICDSSRDRMLVYGGAGPSNNILGDLWALNLSGIPAWTALAPSGAPARAQSCAIYDPLRDRMVLHGGFNGSAVIGDTWALSLANLSWSSLPTPSPPGPRRQHSAVYDAAGDRMILYGSQGAGGDFGSEVDNWAHALHLPTGVWSTIGSGGPIPSARSDAAAIVDPIGRRLIVFGGSSLPYGGVSNETWQFNLYGDVAWARITTTHTPSASYGYSAIYDPTRRRMILLNSLNGRTWTLPLDGGTDWSMLNAPGGPSSYSTRPIYDSVRDRILVSTGTDTWGLTLADPATWVHLATTGNPSSLSGPSIYDPPRDRMLVYNDTAVWALTLSGVPGWSQLTPPGPGPPDRGGASLIYDSRRDRMILFGGRVSIPETWYGDAWALLLDASVDSPPWKSLSPGIPICCHAAVYDSPADRMVVYGGLAAGGVDDLPVASIKALQWEPVLAAPDVGRVPEHLELRMVSANPARDGAVFALDLARGAAIAAGIFDVTGAAVQTVARGRFEAGIHRLDWNGRDANGRVVRPGVYFVRVTAPGAVSTLRFVLLD